jgi:hypothetical protein
VLLYPCAQGEPLGEPGSITVYDSGTLSFGFTLWFSTENYFEIRYLNTADWMSIFLPRNYFGQ